MYTVTNHWVFVITVHRTNDKQHRPVLNVSQGLSVRRSCRRRGSAMRNFATDNRYSRKALRHRNEDRKKHSNIYRKYVLI